MSNYSKGVLADNFNNAYKLFSEKQKDAFSAICFKLLNENYIYGQKDSERELYYQIESFKEILKDYFGIIDYELAQDSVYKIFFLKSLNERNSIKFKKFDSVILLLLRKFYYTKSRETNSNVDVSVTYDELLDEINKTCIYKETLKKTELLNTLRNLKRYKLVNFDYRFYSTSDALTVYPTILYAVSELDLDNMVTILSGYGAKEDGTSDETDDDSID